jgi:hypothetical protein
MMSYSDAISRVDQIQSMIQQIDQPLGTQSAAAASTSSSNASFGSALQQATASQSATAGSSGGDAGMRTLSVAETQLGVTEQPPGSNDGADIARYRSAVAGSYAGAPWCAYFVSWCAAQAGAPIGDGGSGLGSVEGITAWAQRTGRFTSEPAPGELILFGTRHVGIVESVNPDGTLTTVEGNTSDGVHRRTHSVSEATGFVRL